MSASACVCVCVCVCVSYVRLYACMWCDVYIVCEVVNVDDVVNSPVNDDAVTPR